MSTTAQKPKTITLAALDIARSQIGVTEEPGGSNRGKMVESYLHSVGLNGGNAWCMAFVHWVFWMASVEMGQSNPAIRSAGCIDAWNRAGKKGIRRITAAQARLNPSVVSPGMVAIWLINKNTGAGHTGIVEGALGAHLVTIEGNSNENGSREGVCVARQTRRKLTDSILVGFIDYSVGA